MKCPVCNVELVMSDRQGVEIDYCPQCRGVWLDRGELDKVIERSDAMMTARTPRPRHGEDRNYHHSDDNHHYDDRHYRKKRRGSFLGELFDFD
jgi:Uncharacterized protein conserved in bacteria